MADDRNEVLKNLTAAIEELQKGQKSADAEKERKFLVAGVETKVASLRREIETHYATKNEVTNAKLWMIVCICTAVLSLLSPAAVIFTNLFLKLTGSN